MVLSGVYCVTIGIVCWNWYGMGLEVVCWELEIGDYVTNNLTKVITNEPTSEPTKIVIIMFY